MNISILMFVYFCFWCGFVLTITNCVEKHNDENIKEDVVLSSELARKLLWYKRLRNPKFAFMIVGAWWCGKTYGVKHALNESDYYYVSLFNLNSVDEIRNSVISQTTVGRQIGRAIVDVVGNVSKSSAYLGWLSVVKYGWEFLANKYLDRNRLLIFDDLERSRLIDNDLNLLMGAIDFYVQIGCHVVVICNEDCMPEKFRSGKEKIFGYTYRFSAEIEQVENNLCHDLSDDDFLLISKFLPVLNEVWRESDGKSYRIFKSLIMDGVLLLNSIGGEVKNEVELGEFLRFFWVMDTEFRLGRIKKVDFYERNKVVIESLMSKDGKQSILLDVQEKYNVKIDRQWIGDKTLEDMICDGIFRCKKIKDDLIIYTEIFGSKLEDWRVLLHPENYTLDKLTKVNNCVLARVNSKSYFELGELLHLVVVYLNMSCRGELDCTKKEIVDRFKAVVENICNSSDRTQEWIYAIENYSVFETHGGFMYELNDEIKPFFEEVVDCIKINIHKYKRMVLESLVIEALSTVKVNVFEFENILKSNAIAGINISREPVLSYIDAKNFVNIWLSSDNSNAGKISDCLDIRYNRNNIRLEFKEEVEWLKKVSENFDEIYNKSSGLSQYRLEKIRPRILSIVRNIQL